VFESAGWLIQEEPPEIPEGIGNTQLGKRVRLLPAFFSDFWNADHGKVEDYIECLPPEKKESIRQSFFDDRAHVMRLRQRLEKKRAYHRKALKTSCEDNLSHELHASVVEHLDKVLGRNRGGRPIQSDWFEGRREYIFRGIREMGLLEDVGLSSSRSFSPIHDFSRIKCPESLASECFNLALVETMDRIQVPQDMVLQTMLGTLSVACQRWVKVEEPIVSKAIPVSLYLLTVAESGSRKTTLENHFFKPIRECNKALAKEFASKKKEYSIEHEMWLSGKKALMAKFKKLVTTSQDTSNISQEIRNYAEQEPLKPIDPNFLFQDTTESALFIGLQNYWKMGSLLSSEAGSILTGYLLRDSSPLNDLWSGESRSSDRVTRERIELDDVRLSLVLQTQPPSFEKLIDKRGDDLRGDGFFARMLTVFPKINFGHREILSADELQHTPARDQFVERLTSLMNRSTDNTQEEVVLTFSPEAKELWQEYNEIIERLQKDDQPFENMRGFGSKIIEQAVRLSALIHLSFSDEHEINVDVVEYALDLMRGYAGSYQEHITSVPELVVKSERAFQKMVDIYGQNADRQAHDYVEIQERVLYDKIIFKESGDTENILELLEYWGVIQVSGNSRRDTCLLFDPDAGQGTLKEAYYDLMKRKNRRRSRKN